MSPGPLPHSACGPGNEANVVVHCSWLSELESGLLNPGSVLGSNLTKVLGFSVEGWFALEKRICPKCGGALVE